VKRQRRRKKVLLLWHQLEDPQHSVVLAAVLDGHAEDGLVPKAAPRVHALKDANSVV
jgi:hypothetical protein